MDNNLVLISGPSGGGKTTLSNLMLASGGNFTRVVTCTTRRPREGEVDGKDYYFLTPEKFADLKAADAFIECATVYGNSYGTLKTSIIEKLQQGQNVILVMDVQGANTIVATARTMPELRRALVTVFLYVPIDTLRARLQNRGKDSTEVIERRLTAAAAEMEQRSTFDFIITSAAPEDDFQQMQQILQRVHLPMIPFRDQFIGCSNGGFHGEGPSLKLTPDLLPFCPAKRKQMLESGMTRLPTVSCLRFGGRCSSGNTQCREHRRNKAMAKA
jgi:guanylate kinase